MRAGRVVLGVVLVVALAAVAAVAVLPSLLDWDRYRDDIAGLASRGLGRPVRFDGPVSLSLLPEPVLTASGMTVADTGDGITLRADALRLRVALGALLAGRVDARELVLRGADLHLPWPPAPGALAQRPPSWLSGLQARVENGRLQIGHVVFTDVAGTLATDTETGTLSVNGGGRLGDQAWRIIARLGQPGRDGTAALDASVDGADRLRDTGGTFSGQIGADGALNGRATARGPDLSLLLPAPALPWTGEGRLTAAGGLAVADELQVVLAGMPARGAVALRVAPDARLDVALASNRLDLDAWWPVLLRGAAPSLPTGVDLSAEAATFANGQLRRLRVGLDLGPDGAVVREASAELPGAATLSLSGSAGRQGGFRGSALLSAPDLRATLRWIEPSLPGLSALRPDAALATGQVSADVAVENGTVALSNLRGTVDGATVAGRASFRPGARPALTGDLTAEHLLLDPWLPLPQGRDQLTRLRQRFDGFDLSLRLSATGATWQGLPVRSAAVDMQAENGRLTVRSATAQVRRVQVSASGTLGDGGRLADGVLDVAADDVGVLAPLLPAGWTWAAPLLHGPGRLSLRGAGPPDALALRGSADVSDLHVDARPVIDLGSGRLTGPVTMHHPGAPRFLRNLGFDRLADTVGEGSLSALATVSAGPGEIRLDPAQLSTGDARLTGAVTVALGADAGISGQIEAETLPIPALLLQVDQPLPTALLHGWGAHVRVGIGALTWKGRAVAEAVRADATLAGGVLTLSGGTGRVAAGALGFDATVDGAAEPTHFAVRGTLGGATLTGPLETLAPVTVGSATLGLQFDLGAAGHSPAVLLATSAGSVRFALRDGVLYGLDLPGASQAEVLAATPAAVLGAVRAALAGGDGAFSALDGTVTLISGQATLSDSTLVDSAGSVSVSGSAYLPGGTLDIRLERPRTPSAPGYAVRLSGSLHDLVRTPELAGLARELAEAPPSPAAAAATTPP